LKYTLIYAYIRFFSVEHDRKIYAYMRISESGQFFCTNSFRVLSKFLFVRVYIALNDEKKERMKSYVLNGSSITFEKAMKKTLKLSNSPM